MTPRSEPIDSPAARILDANFNRAREALRVMEEYARFVLNDPAVAEQAKRLRHDLAAAIQSHGLADCIRARDIVGDVGREVRTTSEYERPDSAAVVAAAGKRLSEALRVLEEYGKLAGREFAMAMEGLRYRGYELERQLGLRIGARERFGHVRLYVLITEALCRHNWLATAQAALDSGTECLQLREKMLPDRVLVERAATLAGLCHERGALCIVNDRPDVAVLAGADGVHLGQEDLSVSQARRIVGPDRLVGVSTHTLEQFDAAAAESPDYIAFGPMFPSPTKPQEHIPGPAVLGQALSRTSLPVVAIGGITGENVDAVMGTGCRCVCVCHAVIAAADPGEAARSLRALQSSSFAVSGEPRTSVRAVPGE